MKVVCLNRFRGRVPKTTVLKLCRSLLKHFGSHKRVKLSRIKSSKRLNDHSDLLIVFVGTLESQRLNKSYRKRNYATDVLSFSPETSGEGLGELVLCVPVLKRQAREQGHSFKKELDTLVIHGFLHLLGYDHEKSLKEELKMLGLQDKLLKKLI